MAAWREVREKKNTDALLSPPTAHFAKLNLRPENTGEKSQSSLPLLPQKGIEK